MSPLQYVPVLVLIETTLFLLSYSEPSSGLFFTIEPQPIDANIGQIVSFECAAEGFPPPRILWYKDSELIRFNSQRNRVVEIVKSFNHRLLQITGVQHDKDKAEYSCEADNLSGAIRSRRVKLHVPFLLKDKGHFSQVPAPLYTSSPGQGTIIPCQYDPQASWPHAQIFWRKMISESRFEAVETSESRYISRTGTMVITQTRPEDDGVYRCGAKNIKLGTISESDNTKVEVRSGSIQEHEARIYLARPKQSVIRGQTAFLECIPYGYPTPTIVWSKEDGGLPEKGSRSKNGILYTIPAFSVDDQGKYVCAAIQKGVAVVQLTIELTILEPPEFDNPKKNLTMQEGGTLVIPCNPRGTPKIIRTWYKNTIMLQTNIDDKGSLRLVDGNSMTAGMYQCHVKNDVSTAQATFAVSVIGPAKIISKPVPKTVKPGSNTTLTCEAKGSPIPSIVWLKDGEPLPSDPRIRHHEDLYESSVYISNVQISDNGYYECKAINSNGDDSMTTVINVEGPPHINLKPKNTVGITGSDILVKCEATAYPKPTIQWHRNENPLNTQGRKYEVVTEGLLIKEASAFDVGSFMCLAKNRYETVYAPPVQVTVYNIPEISHTLPSTTNVTAGKTALLLQCGITKDFSSYQWFKNNIPLLSVYYDDNITPRIETRKGVGLYFQSVLPEDQGFYSCNVSNPAASASTSGYLFVDVMPTITYITSNFEVREYETFWINCIYEGMPTPDLQWTHNNGPLHREHTIMANGTLRITSATRFDSGAYQCIVSNRQGTKKKDTIVTVRSKARIEIFPAIQYPITAQKSTITCEVSGYPFPTVEWEKNGARIETYNNNGYIKSGTNLIIREPDRSEHDGLYTCTARNDYGSDSRMSKIEVLDAPQIENINGCGSVKQGLDCKMRCEATGNPLPTLTWRYRHQNYTRIIKSDNRRFFITLIDSKSKVRTVDFMIKNLKSTDSNLYYCHAENPAGIASQAYQLVVRYPSNIVTPPLGNYEIPIGAVLTISCVATGEPEPKITWTRESGSLPPNGRSRVEADGSLVIINIAREDEGKYTCTADNNADNSAFQFQKVSRTTTVKVTDKDSPLGVMDNPVETWLIVVICICVFVVCLVVFFSVKMIRDRGIEKRSYQPSALLTTGTASKQPEQEATYQFETLRSKPVTFNVPVDNSNSLPMYSMKQQPPLHPPPPAGGTWVGGKQNSNIDMQLDDVDKQLSTLLRDVDNLRLDNYESDI